MAEGADGLEARVGEVRVVGAEHVRRAHHLVDAGGPGEARDVDAEPALQLQQQLEDDGVAVRGIGDEAGDLPEDRLLLARGRAERGRVDLADPLGEDPEAALGEQLAGVVLDLLDVLGALEEDVGDGEGVVEGERRVMAADPDLLGPDLPRQVEQQAAAVPLAVDVAGPVEHLLQRRDRQRDRFVARGRVLAHRRVDRAGIVLFDALRRDQRPIRAVPRVVLGLNALDAAARRAYDWTSGPPGFRAFFERARDGVCGSANYRAGPQAPRRVRRNPRYAGISANARA